MIYSDALSRPLMRNLGASCLSASRASNVELSADAQTWSADLSPVNGPKIGNLPTRDAAITAEVDYLHTHVISNPKFFKAP